MDMGLEIKFEIEIKIEMQHATRRATLPLLQ
jgi:hypothetical protein